MTLIAEKILGIISAAKQELQDAISQCAAYVEALEEQHVYPLDIEHMSEMDRLSQRIQIMNEDITRYALFQPDLMQEVDQADDIIEQLADRFLELGSTPPTMNVKEAAVKFNRSKSTIYRWIKSGKLNAQKINRRWQIFI